MWGKLRTAGLAALSTLLAVEAGVWSDRQFHFNAHRANLFDRQVSDAANSTDSSSSSFRFLNGNTTKYQVHSLPDVNYNLGEMYAGNIPLSRRDNRTLFFVFQPSIGKKVDEVVIWLNGGPGCSSLGGFFQENGKFLWQPGVFKPTDNPYSWVNETNMLWVEQPVGVGYTTGTPRATSEEDIARDFADWFRTFQETFGIKKFKIYVTGESYAGRYIPYISAEMLNRKNTDYFNVSGNIIYDGVIGQFLYTQEQAVVVPYVLANANQFNFNQTFTNQLISLDKSCGYAAYRQKYLQFPAAGKQPAVPANQPQTGSQCDIFDLVFNAAQTVNPCFNIYSTNEQCPLLWDVLGFPTALFYQSPGSQIYFDRADVKKALNAPADSQWAICKNGVFIGNGGPEGEGDTSADPIQKVLPQVIEATNRVLIANGDLDMIIITNGSLLAIQNMTWNGKMGFQQRPSTPMNIQLPDLQYQSVFANNGEAGIDGPQGIMGVQHYERGLLWSQVYLEGHEGPQFQPRAAYRHLQWVLGRIDTL